MTIFSSLVEAEFKALAHGICEDIGTKRIFEELKISLKKPIRIYCDNKTGIIIQFYIIEQNISRLITFNEGED